MKLENRENYIIVKLEQKRVVKRKAVNKSKDNQKLLDEIDFLKLELSELKAALKKCQESKKDTPDIEKLKSINEKLLKDNLSLFDEALEYIGIIDNLKSKGA